MLLTRGMIFRVSENVFDGYRRRIGTAVKQINAPRVPHNACQCYPVCSYSVYHMVCMDCMERGPLGGTEYSDVTMQLGVYAVVRSYTISQCMPIARYKQRRVHTM